MPQFDPHYFSSQIFWLTVCFAILYYFVSNIILPRIRDILKERKSVIDSDTLQANQLDQAIDEISSKTVALRMKATKEYQEKLEEATKAASSKREKLTEELKEKIEIITKKSQEDLKNFIASTHAQSRLAIQDLTKNIKSKLFNIS